MMRGTSRNAPFAVGVITILATVLTLLPVPTAVRVPAAFLLIMVLPGLALEPVVGIRSRSDPVLRGLTVLATGIALSIATGLVLDLTPGVGITLTSSAVGLGFLCLLLCAVGALREFRTSPAMPVNARLLSTAHDLRRMLPGFVAFAALVVVSVVVAVQAFKRQDHVPVTTAWIVPGKGPGCTLGVTQRYAGRGRYRLTLRKPGARERGTEWTSNGRFNWRWTVKVPPRLRTGRIEASLFQLPDTRRPLRRVTIATSECHGQ
jgi:hypothetical protein